MVQPIYKKGYKFFPEENVKHRRMISESLVFWVFAYIILFMSISSLSRDEFFNEDTPVLLIVNSCNREISRHCKGILVLIVLYWHDAS